MSPCCWSPKLQLLGVKYKVTLFYHRLSPSCHYLFFWGLFRIKRYEFYTHIHTHEHMCESRLSLSPAAGRQVGLQGSLEWVAYKSPTQGLGKEPSCPPFLNDTFPTSAFLGVRMVRLGPSRKGLRRLLTLSGIGCRPTSGLGRQGPRAATRSSPARWGTTL